MDKDTKLTILISIFISGLIAANLLGNKITTILGVSFSVGIFAYPFTFVVTDIVEEVYGKKKTQGIIYGGMIAIVFVLLLTLLSVYLPPASRFDYNDAYKQVFGVSTRILIASLIAFVISQTHDVWSFNYWKQKTKGKHLWIRNNLSTMSSQFIDTTLFMFIAFYNITPKFSVGFIFSLIIPYWLLKILMAALDTPLVYIGVKWLKK